MKKVLKNTFKVIIAFVIYSYLAFCSLAGPIFLLSANEINWWQCILIFLPLFAIIGNFKSVCNYSFGDETSEAK